MSHRCFFGFSLDNSSLTVVTTIGPKSKDEVLSTLSLIFRKLGRCLYFSIAISKGFSRWPVALEFTRGDIKCIYNVGEEFIKGFSSYNFISN